MSDGNNASRATAAALGAAVGIVSAWAFKVLTGLEPPTEVAVAWGNIMAAVVGLAYSRLGV